MNHQKRSIEDMHDVLEDQMQMHIVQQKNSDEIDLDLQDYVLGQHAGQLLLDLNREYINKEDKYYEDDRKINMPAGMIVNGIYVSALVNQVMLFQS